MSAHTKKHLTDKIDDKSLKIVIEKPGQKRQLSFLPSKHWNKLEALLEKYGQTESIHWEVLASDRIAKYKKAGIALRGARYREGLSQEELSMLVHISQNNISKMENGLRPIGKIVAKRLAEVLNVDFRLFLDV